MNKELVKPIIFKEAVNTIKLMRIIIDIESEYGTLLFGIGNTIEGKYEQITTKTIPINKDSFAVEMSKIFSIPLTQIKESMLNYGETAFIAQAEK